MRTSVEVTRITSDNSDAVAAFYRKVWANSATGEGVRRARAEAARLNPTTPGADVPAVAYLRDGEVVGHLGTIPAKFWNGAVETTAHWLKGFMVLPQHQNGPVGYAVLQEMLRHVDVVGSMVVAPPARRLLQAVGFVDCGVIPNYVCLLRPARIAKSIDIANLGFGLPRWLCRSARALQQTGVLSVGGSLAGQVLSAHRTLFSSPTRFFTEERGELPAQSAIDDLWTRARPAIRAGAVRDGALMRWRYEARSRAPYEAVVVRERAGRRRLAAVAVVRRCGDSPDERLPGIRVATVADILFAPDQTDAGLAALTGAERIALSMGADALLCSSAHPAITSVLRRRAYLRLPGNVHLMIRDKHKNAGLPLTAETWWLTRGDGSADEAF